MNVTCKILDYTICVSNGVTELLFRMDDLETIFVEYEYMTIRVKGQNYKIYVGDSGMDAAHKVCDKIMKAVDGDDDYA